MSVEEQPAAGAAAAVTAAAGEDETPAFKRPVLTSNAAGWGPVGVPAAFADIPFQQFSKSDKIGKVADWSENSRFSDRRYAARYQQFGTGSAFSYFHDDDDTSFSLVDRSGSTRPGFMRFGRGRMNRVGAQRSHRDPRNRQQDPYQALTKDRKWNKHNAANKAKGKGQKTQNRRYGGFRRYDNTPAKLRDASVEVKPEWKMMEEMEFPQLMKLQCEAPPEPKDIYTMGAMEWYDRKYDRVDTRSEMPMLQQQAEHHYVSTTDDPIIRQLSKKGAGNVFATDAILSALMCSTRSIYPFDIVVSKVGDLIFLDKRDGPHFDFLSVNENAQDPPDADDAAEENRPDALAREATYINHNFSQQVLKKAAAAYKYEHENVFAEGMGEGEEVASVGYRYRQWQLSEDITLVARTQLDAVMKGPAPGDAPQLLNIKALNEFTRKVGMDWRNKLDSQRGAVLATEMKNNNYKVAKWTTSALLAGADRIKLGYISRSHPQDPNKHVLLGMQVFKPTEMASQIALNMHNAWGILRTVIDICRKLPQGKYLLLRDPNKPILRLYEVPMDAFESEEEESDSDEDENPFKADD